jgi:hypothetical protein
LIHTDEENYTTEEPSGSSFFVGIFSNYEQSNSYPNQVQNTISNFNQGGYYTNCPYDSSIYSHLYPSVYQQPNPAVTACHTYNFFSGSNSTYEESKFQDNCGNLVDDFNLHVFDGNLSLGRAEEQSNIGGSSNIDRTVMELSDDQDEQDDASPQYWSKVET